MCVKEECKKGELWLVHIYGSIKEENHGNRDLKQTSMAHGTPRLIMAALDKSNSMDWAVQNQ